jgi:hypothetical protein
MPELEYVYPNVSRKRSKIDPPRGGLAREKRQNYSEQQVKQGSNDIVSDTDKIVFVTRYSRDMDRFRSLYNVAKENDRKFVISTRDAYLLSKLVDDKRLDLPDPVKDKTIRVYYKRKKSGDHVEKDYYMWERPFLEKKVTWQGRNLLLYKRYTTVLQVVLQP